MGYLAYDNKTKKVFIPDEEVRSVFIRAIKNDGWDEVMRAVNASEALLNATLAGFSDMVFLPKRTSIKPALILELKWDKTVEGAISQIKNKKYAAALKEYRGNILLVGINYDKKSRKHQCKIEKVEI